MEESSCLLVLYGHSARVWRASFLPKHHGDGVVSIGEDATCRVWGVDGSTRSVLKGHRGKSIWSLALSLSSNTLVSTKTRTHSAVESLLLRRFGTRRCP